VSAADRTCGSSAPTPANSSRSYFSDWSQYTGGVSVAAGDLNGDGLDELATARATDGTEVTIIDPATLKEYRRIPARAATGHAGVRLAIVPGSGLLIGNGPGAEVEVDSVPDLNAQAKAVSPNEPLRAYGVFVG
jgi:hypothetical protein